MRFASLYHSCGISLIAAIVAPVVAAAQAREVERRGFDEGQGRLIAFYSAALTFSPAAAPLAAASDRLRLGLELSYIPRLSERQRRAGDKPEATNLAPLLPRPRAAVTLPGRWMLEASWIPPLQLFDVKANVGSLALSRPITAPHAITITPRLAGTIGRVEGAITCYDELARGAEDVREYYSEVCYGHRSADHFEPRHLTGELIGSYALRRGPLAPYAGIGVRYDRTRFDIGVLKPDAGVPDGPRVRDPDQPILDLAATRAYLFAGATLLVRTRLRTSGELFYAPGSLVTVRVQGSVDVLGR